MNKKLVIQFLEYMVGGGVYFWSGLGVFALCYSVLHWDWLVAKMLADIIGWSLGFVVQRYWAFNDSRLASKTLQTGKRYIGITLLNLGIDYLIVASLKAFGVTPYLGMLSSAMFFTAWNYLWYRFWVFKPTNN